MSGEVDSDEAKPILDDQSLSRGFWSDPDPLSQLQFPFEGGERSESFIWREYAPSLDEVHARGCAREKKKNLSLPADAKKKAYAGAGTAQVKAVRAIVSRGYFLRVTHVPEGGDAAHAHVTMISGAGGSTESMPKNDRIEIKRKLLQQLMPLDLHTCEQEDPLSKGEAVIPPVA